MSCLVSGRPASLFVFNKSPPLLCRVSGGGRMSVEVDLLLQEAKESIEAAQNYRSELQQRLHGLNQARKQVPPPFHLPTPSQMRHILRFDAFHPPRAIFR